MNSYVVHRNGHPASAAELGPCAFAGYAHFTAMQVRAGRVRGLDLHLDRLRSASDELFGGALPDALVRDHLRAAVAAGPSDLSLSLFVHAASGEITADVVATDVLVRTGPAAAAPAGPLALAVVEHERTLPAIMHVGEVAKTYFLRQAAAHGFDDAAFVDRRGRLSEATIWNLAFWDGSSVVWPDADVLTGVTMGIVRRQLDALGVPQLTRVITPADVRALAGAVVMNSWTPGIAVHRFGAVDVPVAPSFVELLHRAYQAEPLVSP